MMINPTAMKIRAKKLGALIRDARLACGKSIEDCAGAIGVPVEGFEAYELGDRSPSLPELEFLAYTLDIPLDHFWGGEALSAAGRQGRPDGKRVIALRQRKIGAMLRQARLEAGLGLEELAEKAWSAAPLLEAYELGEAPVPVPDLEAICTVLNLPVKDFQDHSGPVGAWASRQAALRGFQELSPELQAFVSRPINRPYLELAVRLSEMSVDKLRAVAEGLLEITL